MPLRVGVIGAGIGGLSAAVGLRRAGAEVEVFEKSRFANEAGAAITLTPNGLRVLARWGFDAASAGVVPAVTNRLVHARDLATAETQDLTGVARNFGAGVGYVHRADLHGALRELAERESPSDDSNGNDKENNRRKSGPPVIIRLGNGVVDVDCDRGVVILADGTRATKDLLVIADGVRSRFLDRVMTGQHPPEPARDMGWSAYRCLIPMADILADPRTRPLFAGQPAGYWTPFDLAKAFYMVTYPCRGGSVLNVVLRHTAAVRPQEQDQDQIDRNGNRVTGNDDIWNAPATHAEVLDLLGEYHPLIGDIIRKAPEIKVYRLLRRAPLATYSRGRAVVLGDAAHTVLPTHAQGSMLAMEEAAALELLFDGVDTDDTVNADDDLVPARLRLYEAAMKRHIHVVQHLSEAVPARQDDAHRRRAEELCGPDDGLYPATAHSFSPPVMRFFYGYDVRAEVTKTMREAGLETR